MLNSNISQWITTEWNQTEISDDSRLESTDQNVKTSNTWAVVLSWTLTDCRRLFEQQVVNPLQVALQQVIPEGEEGHSSLRPRCRHQLDHSWTRRWRRKIKTSLWFDLQWSISVLMDGCGHLWVVGLRWKLHSPTCPWRCRARRSHHP